MDEAEGREWAQGALADQCGAAYGEWREFLVGEVARLGLPRSFENAIGVAYASFLAGYLSALGREAAYRTPDFLAECISDVVGRREEG